MPPGRRRSEDAAADDANGRRAAASAAHRPAPPGRSVSWHVDVPPGPVAPAAADDGARPPSSPFSFSVASAESSDDYGREEASVLHSIFSPSHAGNADGGGPAGGGGKRRRDGGDDERRHSVEELFSPPSSGRAGGRTRRAADIAGFGPPAASSSAAPDAAADELEDEFGTIRAILLGAGKGGGGGSGGSPAAAQAEEDARMTARMLVQARSLALAARPSSDRSPAGKTSPFGRAGGGMGERRPEEGKYRPRDPVTPARSTRTAEFHTPRSTVSAAAPPTTTETESDDTFDGVTIEIDAAGGMRCDDSALEDESLDSRVDRAYRRIDRAREEAERVSRSRAGEAERGQGAAGGGAGKDEEEQEEEFFSPLSLHSVRGPARSGKAAAVRPRAVSVAAEEAPPTARAAAVRPQLDGEAPPSTSGTRSPPQCSGGYDSVKHQLKVLLAEAKELSPGKRSEDGGGARLGNQQQQRREQNDAPPQRSGGRIAEPRRPMIRRRHQRTSMLGRRALFVGKFRRPGRPRPRQRRPPSSRRTRYRSTS